MDNPDDDPEREAVFETVERVVPLLPMLREAIEALQDQQQAQQGADAQLASMQRQLDEVIAAQPPDIRDRIVEGRSRNRLARFEAPPPAVIRRRVLTAARELRGLLRFRQRNVSPELQEIIDGAAAMRL